MYRARAVYSIPTTPISTPVSVCVHHIRLVSVKEETPPVLREIFFFFPQRSCWSDPAIVELARWSKDKLAYPPIPVMPKRA